MEPALRPYAFVLAARDFDAVAAYFRDCLGFTLEWETASDWRLVSRGSARVMIGACPNAAPAADTGDHSYFGYLEVDGVDALHREFAARGAIILQPPADRPYGMREMLVATPEGHRMTIAQPARTA
jgi:predicted enzyme related to lactoylglutathione lyase